MISACFRPLFCSKGRRLLLRSPIPPHFSSSPIGLQRYSICPGVLPMNVAHRR